MNNEKLTIEDVSEKLSISQRTIKKYVRIFHDELKIDIEEFDFLFTQEMVDKITLIRKLSKKPSYQEIKEYLNNYKFWNRLNQEISKHKDKLGKYSLGLSAASVILGAYSLINEELTNQQDSEKLIEIGKISNRLDTISDELDQLEKVKKPLSNTVNLREKPNYNLSESEVGIMLKKYDFLCEIDRHRYNKTWSNPKGKGLSTVDCTLTKKKGEYIVIDYITGLTWQHGHSSPMLYSETSEYLTSLNQKKFAGYNNWRLPTLEEAMSLVGKEYSSNPSIYMVFPKIYNKIFTSDRVSAPINSVDGKFAPWVVDLFDCRCDTLGILNTHFEKCCVRAVCSKQL